MKYDFDTVVDRRNTGSLKWDVEPNELPMWVADMDFPTAPAIRAASIGELTVEKDRVDPSKTVIICRDAVKQVG